MLTAIYIALCIICGLLVAIVVDIGKIAKVVEAFDRKDGEHG